MVCCRRAASTHALNNLCNALSSEPWWVTSWMLAAAALVGFVACCLLHGQGATVFLEMSMLLFSGSHPHVLLLSQRYHHTAMSVSSWPHTV
jgi:hypothetical protein